MNEKYIVISAKNSDGIDKVPEHISNLDYLIKVDKNGEKTKISYKPPSNTPGVELVNFLNKNYPDMEFLITAISLSYAGHLKTAKNIIFKADTPISQIAELYKNNQLYPNQAAEIKNESSSQQVNQNDIAPQETKKTIDWLLFVVILVVLLFFIFSNSDYITEIISGIVG